MTCLTATATKGTTLGEILYYRMLDAYFSVSALHSHASLNDGDIF